MVAACLENAYSYPHPNFGWKVYCKVFDGDRVGGEKETEEVAEDRLEVEIRPPQDRNRHHVSCAKHLEENKVFYVQSEDHNS